MSIKIIHGNALALPIEDNTVDLVVTSPPYFGLRSYQDGGEHYEGQIGSEATPAEFVDALIAATREMVRVLKPSGSIWVNLGDKYAGSPRNMPEDRGVVGTGPKASHARKESMGQTRALCEYRTDVRPKSLIGIPWRYALRCIDELGLILRAEVIWSKPNGLPESVTDRVRRSHEQWFHFTVNPRYYSAVDEIREPHTEGWGPIDRVRGRRNVKPDGTPDGGMVERPNALGKLPGSVWTIPTQPLRVPANLGIDHFAAFPMEWPRRIITGWSPREVCGACGEGRRPVVEKALEVINRGDVGSWGSRYTDHHSEHQHNRMGKEQVYGSTVATVTGYACACPDTTAPTTPGLVLDPFGGTGTVALVADVLDRDAIHVDLSRDYNRLAEWRTTDPGERARAMQVEKPAAVIDGQGDLLEGLTA